MDELNVSELKQTLQDFSWQNGISYIETELLPCIQLPELMKKYIQETIQRLYLIDRINNLITTEQGTIVEDEEKHPYKIVQNKYSEIVLDNGIEKNKITLTFDDTYDKFIETEDNDNNEKYNKVIISFSNIVSNVLEQKLDYKLEYKPEEVENIIVKCISEMNKTYKPVNVTPYNDGMFKMEISPDSSFILLLEKEGYVRLVSVLEGSIERDPTPEEKELAKSHGFAT